MTAEILLTEAGIIGDSLPIKALGSQIETASASDLTVLITGESGTGKELVARAIHDNSSRAAKPFVSFNCGAIAESLLESELFGYERGAFTGANHSRPGLFAAANTGTIFLDEIGEMSQASQVRLLRVLQENAVRPIGSHAEVPIDVRVIAATNRNLAHEISRQRFREDLFYRIAVLTIHTPALRERSSDIPLLVEHFLREAETKAKSSRPRQIHEDALATLASYDWPGNVRQLLNVVERLVAAAPQADILTSSSVQQALATVPHPKSELTNDTRLPVELIEGETLDGFLDRTMLSLYAQIRADTGSHAEAARVLGTDRVSLYQRIARARKRVQGNGRVA